MLGDRFLTITAVYDRHPSYGRTLDWLAPELTDARLPMTEDRSEDERSPSRTWAGTVHKPIFERFAAAWRLPDEGEDRLAGPVAHVYALDGMNWETGGESPIVCVSVSVGPASRT